MIIANFVTNRPTMSDTKTYEDFYKFLGSIAQLKFRELLEPLYSNNLRLGESAANVII